MNDSNIDEIKVQFLEGLEDVRDTSFVHYEHIKQIDRPVCNLMSLDNNVYKLIKGVWCTPLVHQHFDISEIRDKNLLIKRVLFMGLQIGLSLND